MRLLPEDEPQVRIMLRGLGNQLFGWAAGFSLAERLNASLVLDTTRIARGDYALLEPRHFELRRIQGRSPGSHLRINLRESLSKRKIRRTHPKRCQVFREKSFEYDPLHGSLHGSVCLEGYFQSWRYFGEDYPRIRGIIRQHLALNHVTRTHLWDLSGQPWVAIHVRKGDYTRISSMADITRKYYGRAIARLLNTNKSLKFVTFSQNMDDAMGMVPDADLHLDASKVASAWDVLGLMSRATALIGANSSLSWWAAYLSDRDGHANTFPARWFADETISVNDLLRPEWNLVQL